MIKKSTFWTVLLLVVLGFAIGIYLQDLKHKESTANYWKANRHNMSRLNNIIKYTTEMNPRNWPVMRDSIASQLDTLIILRFRKEMDSMQKKKGVPTKKQEHLSADISL